MLITKNRYLFINVSYIDDDNGNYKNFMRACSSNQYHIDLLQCNRQLFNESVVFIQITEIYDYAYF